MSVPNKQYLLNILAAFNTNSVFLWLPILIGKNEDFSRTFQGHNRTIHGQHIFKEITNIQNSKKTEIEENIN